MIFFGHLGLTVGAAKLAETAAAKNRKLPQIDYRLVMVGAILPDLIDKPIGALLFVDTYHNSRIYAHSLLFSVLLLVWGLLRYKKRKKAGVLTLAFGSLFHLVLDSMWRYEEILWPFWNIKAALAAKGDWLRVLLGFPYRFEEWISKDISSILENPAPLLFEAAGILVLAFFFIRLIREKKLMEYFKSGKL